MSAFFAVDLGNSRASIGIADEGGLRDVLRVPIGALADLTRGFSLIGGAAGSAPVAVSSVNPKALDEMRRLAQKFTSGPVLVAGKDFPIPIEVAVKEPQRVGTDRLLASLAAYRRARGACIVLDFGTATTVDAISADGRFLGGAIIPGIDLMAKSLATGTAALPEVQVKKPDEVIGKNTESAITSGIYFGYFGLIDGLVARFQKSLGAKAVIWATGGAFAKLADDMKNVDHVAPNLVLEGLVIAYREFSEK